MTSQNGDAQDYDRVLFGLTIGSLPTCSMVLASCLCGRVAVHRSVEAVLLHFAAGLILAAVASELFPLMTSSVTPLETWVGVSFGFIAGVSLLQLLEVLLEKLVTYKSSSTLPLEPMAPVAEEIGSIDDEEAVQSSSSRNSLGMASLLGKMVGRSSSPSSAGFIALSQRDDIEKIPKLETNSNRSLSVSSYVELQEEATSMIQALDVVESLYSPLLQDSAPAVSKTEADNIIDTIDSNTHELLYKLSKLQRLIRSTECHDKVNGNSNIIDSKSWNLAEEDKEELREHLEGVKTTRNNITKTLHSMAMRKDIIHHDNNSNSRKASDSTISHGNFNMTDEISCINEHITKMRETVFHSHHATNITTPRTGRHVLLGAEPELGATLPASLVIPVTLDCFVDGFLIGVTSGLSPHAGIVLGIANCLEMGFLGMAYSLRLKKCTGSGWALQQIALFGPPGLMFLSSGLGAYAAHEARDSPAVFVGFVAFGTVALLSLVCTELLIEAKEAQGEQQVWYAPLALYLAVYLVLMSSRFGAS